MFYGWQNPATNSQTNPQAVASPQAYNLSIPPVIASSNHTMWYPDSGATHHVTNDHSTMIDPTVYQGT